jgi:hypothetical protein
MGDFLARPEWQGIGVIVAVAIAAVTWWEAHRVRQLESPRPLPHNGGGGNESPTVVRRLTGALLVIIATYVLFAGMWAL